MTNRSLNIFHIHGSDGGGGAEIAAYSLHKELVRRGHHSRMIVAKKQSQDDTVIEIPWERGVPGLKRITLKLEKYFGFQYLYSPSFRQVYKLFPKDLDILHIHSLHGIYGYADIGALPRFAKRWPTVMSLQDMWMLTGHCGYPTGCERWKFGCGMCPSLELYPSITKDATRFNWHRKYLVIRRSNLHGAACSQWLASQASLSPIFRNTPVVAVPNAIDTKIFFPRSKISSRQNLQLPLDKFIILLLANSLQNPWKGIPDAIGALNRIKDKNTLVILVGKDKKIVKDRLKISHKAMPYELNRKFLAEIYRAADVLLMPSIEEAFGLVAAESMACGTPVIAYDTGGLPEVIGNDGAGILVPSRDIDGLTTAINRASCNKEKIIRMSQIAARRSALLFSLKTQTDRFLDLYDRIIETHRRRKIS